MNTENLEMFKRLLNRFLRRINHDPVRFLGHETFFETVNLFIEHLEAGSGKRQN